MKVMSMMEFLISDNPEEVQNTGNCEFDMLSSEFEVIRPDIKPETTQVFNQFTSNVETIFPLESRKYSLLFLTHLNSDYYFFFLFR